MIAGPTALPEGAAAKPPHPDVPRRRVRDRLRGLDGWTIAAIAIAVLISIPILTVIGNVGQSDGTAWQHLVETNLAIYVVNSLLLMVGVGFGVVAIGAGTAWLVTTCRFPGRRLLEWALLLPLALPAYLLAYVYTDMLDYSGPVQSALRDVFGWTTKREYWFPEIRSLPGAVIMLTLALYPYVYLMTRAALSQQCVCVLEVSRTLGCGPWGAFRRVGLPLARPAIAGGTALALMETLNDFGTVDFFGVQTFTTGIYRTWFGLGDVVAAMQLAAVLLVFVFCLIALERWTRGFAKYHHATNRYRSQARHELTGGKRIAATLACAIPVCLGFAIPAIDLAVRALAEPSTSFGTKFLASAGNSLILAGTAAAVGVVLALVLCYAKRLRPRGVVPPATSVATLGYAVPGSVIAIGILVPLAALDNAVDALAERWFGIDTGLLLTGTIAALVFAYLVRFLAVAVNPIDSSLKKVRPSIDGAARTLGCGPLSALRRVHVPMVLGGVLTAAILVFVDVMKELPATLIVRPFNFDTLAVQTYRLASDQRLDEASGFGLAIVLFGLLPVILLTRAMDRARPGHGRNGGS